MCLHYLEVFLSVFQNFFELCRRELVTGGNNSAEQLNLVPYLLYSIFKSLKRQNSLSLIRFQCIYILHHSTWIPQIFPGGGAS